MAKKEDRFVRVYTQGGFGTNIQIWVDKVTGVNYLYAATGQAAGLTVLLNRDGTPVVTAVPRKEDE